MRAELDADATVQAVLADLARQREVGAVSLLVMSDDGEIRDVVEGTASGMRPLSDVEIRAMLGEEGVK